MKTKFIALAALAAVCGSAMAAENPWVLDNQKQFLTSNFEKCVKTGYWTPAAAEQFTCGKPAAKKVVVQKPLKKSVTVLFDFNKDALTAEAKGQLTQFVKDVQGLKVEKVTVVGHADRIGTVDANAKISAKRAAKVTEFLAGQKVANIATSSKGMSKPVVVCAEDEGNLVACLRENRRVEVQAFYKP